MLIKSEPHFKRFVTRNVLTCGTQAEPWWRAEHQNQAKRGNGTASQCEFHLSWGSSGRSCVLDSHHTRCVRSQGEPGDKKYFSDGRQSLILSVIRNIIYKELGSSMMWNRIGRWVGPDILNDCSACNFMVKCDTLSHPKRPEFSVILLWKLPSAHHL
jgi:hypothetical protein